MTNLPLSWTNNEDPAGAGFFCFALAPLKIRIVAVATRRTSLEFMRINIATLLHCRRISRGCDSETRRSRNGSLPQTSLQLTSFVSRCTQNDTKALRNVRAGACPRPDGFHAAQSR